MRPKNGSEWNLRMRPINRVMSGGHEWPGNMAKGGRVLMCEDIKCVNVCSTVSQGHCAQLQRLGGHEDPKGRPCLLLTGKPVALLLPCTQALYQVWR